MQPTLTAYRLPGYANYPRIVPASPDREWIDAGTKGWANRCLPLRIANQAGWFLLNETDVELVWNETRAIDGLKVRYPDPKRPGFASSMFGYGIVTWSIPYLFQTSAGYNLQARGPANWSYPGLAPLDGIVETDWLPFPFTMNWQMTAKKARIKAGDPICMLVPVRRGELDGFATSIKDLSANPELHQSYETWLASRRARVQEIAEQKDGAARMQGHYVRGEGHLGERPVHGHETKLNLQPFRNEPSGPDGSQTTSAKASR